MKHLTTVLFLGLIFLIVACRGNNTELSGEPHSDDSRSKLHIGYNVNIETLALIYNLSESGDYHFNEIIGPRGTLAKELTRQFESYREHDAVKKLNALLDDGFVDMYDIILSCYHTDLPEFKQFSKYPAVYYENDGLTAEETQDRFDAFNAAVVQFYHDANLQTHFEKTYKKLYEKIMNEVRTVAPSEKFIEEAEAYYGIKRDTYEIIVSAFSFNGIGQAKLISENGKTKAISLVTSNHLVESDTIDLNDLSSFKVGYSDKKYFQEIGLHELIHTFFHEALKENQDNWVLIDEIDYLFTEKLRSSMLKQGYVDWRMCFEEHLVRIGEIKIAARMGNQDFVIEYRKRCVEDRGFIYFEIIEQLFEKYEKNRSSYKTINDFIPDLVQELKRKLPNNDD